MIPARLAVLSSLTLACLPPQTRGGPTSAPGPTSVLIEAGAGVALLPDGSPVPEPCPESARAVMKALRLRPGDTARIEIDANQFQREPLTVFAGPVESIMLEPMGQLEGASRLYGRIWTAERQLVIRYYHAQMAGAEVIPICAVARTAGGQLAGKPGKYPQSTELRYSAALLFIVEDFL